jgi:alkylhydroperoxidase family enzyme
MSADTAPSNVLNLPLPEVEFQARQQLARLPITQPPGTVGKLIGWASKKMLGKEADNGYAMAHNRRVLFAVMNFERRVAKFNALDPTLKALATMTAAAEIGCSWCVDFGYFVADKDGLDLAKLQHINEPDWSGYSDAERRVIEFARGATATPAQVSDELVAALRADLGDKALVELTMIVAIENERSRFNAALGLVSQGFSASCQLPAR